MIIKWRNIEAILAALSHAMVITTCNITRRSIQLTGKLASCVHATSLSSDRLLYFRVIAIHLYFPASLPCLGSQTRNDAIGSLIMTGIDNADTTLITHLLTGSIPIKDNNHPVRRMAIAIYKLGNERATSSSQIPYLNSLKRGTIFNDIIAIDQDILPQHLCSFGLWRGPMYSSLNYSTRPYDLPIKSCGLVLKESLEDWDYVPICCNRKA